jgi:putative endonuclease
MWLNHSYFVYIIACVDGSYYTAITNNLDRRMWKHNARYYKTCYAYKRRAVELKY